MTIPAQPHMPTANQQPKRFTGRHATMLFILFFGIIMAVNFTMARYATATFGGVVVKNSYVASQEFNTWLENAEEQARWGWQISSHWQEDGHVAITLEGVPSGAVISATARHPLGRRADSKLEFRQIADGHYISTIALPDDRWTLRLAITADGKTWRADAPLQ